MYLGSRSIRSAGRNSGSIEITMPARLQALQGINCNISVRDGAQPEIVLRPDLSATHALYNTLWQHMALGLDMIEAIGPFNLADFTLSLFPVSHWQNHPPLIYLDALTILQPTATTETQPSAEKLEAFARLIAAQGLVAGQRLALTPNFALAFGDALAYCLTETSPGLSSEFERGMAHRAFHDGSENGATGPQNTALHLMEEDTWQALQDKLQRVYDQFYNWQRQPESYQAARESWYRALNIELNLTPSSLNQS